MKRVVVDASVLAAVAFGEPQADDWTRLLDGVAVFAPRLLRYELQNVAATKCRRSPDLAPQILRSLEVALNSSRDIAWVDPSPADVVLIANATGLSGYDAAYLCLAGMLGADLMTADRKLAAALAG